MDKSGIGAKHIAFQARAESQMNCKKKKYKAIFLLDSNAVGLPTGGSAGHAGLLLGNEEDGYFLYSKWDAGLFTFEHTPEDLLGKTQKSLAEWQQQVEGGPSRVDRYTDAFEIDITEEQYRCMRFGANVSMSQPYQIVRRFSPISSLPEGGNCMHIWIDALRAADMIPDKGIDDGAVRDSVILAGGVLAAKAIAAADTSLVDVIVKKPVTKIIKQIAEKTADELWSLLIDRAKDVTPKEVFDILKKELEDYNPTDVNISDIKGIP